jgi:hypothetical protein
MTETELVTEDKIIARRTDTAPAPMKAIPEWGSGT